MEEPLLKRGRLFSFVRSAADGEPRYTLPLRSFRAAAMTVASLAAPIILVLVYGGAAIRRIPCLRLDRAGVAFLGGAAMIAFSAASASTRRFAPSTGTRSRCCSA
jgi:hypothetical protein